MNFNIKIQETLARTVSIEAETEEEALYRVRQLYKKCEIVLDSEDFTGVIFMKEI